MDLLGNNLKLPGSETLDKMLGGQGKASPPKPIGKNLAYGHGGGRFQKAAKEAAAEKAEQDEDAKAEKERANTPPPENPADRTVVKITNIQWEGKSLAIGSTAFATMDVSIPPEYKNLTKITCTLEQEASPGNWKHLDATFEECHAKDEKARCEFKVPEPPNKADGKPPEKPHFRLVAKHSYSQEAKGPPIAVVPGAGSEFDSVIYYSPIRGEYLCLENENDYKALLPEFERMDKVQALSKNALESKDEKERKEAQEKLAEQLDDLFEKETVGDTNAAIEELLLVRHNKKWGERGRGWVYIRPYAKKNETMIKGTWRKESDATLKKNLDDLLKKAPGSKEHSPLFESEFKAKLFSSDPLKTQKLIWGAKAEVGKEGKGFSFTGEAAVCRFAANFTPAESSMNLKEKKVSIGSSGSVSFALLEGKAEGKYPLPVDGINILAYLQHSKYLDDFIKKGRKCLLRLNVTFGAKGFAGMTVSGALNLLELDLEKEKPTSKAKGGAHASMGASADAFAGAQVSGEFSIGPEWSRGEGVAKFDSLGSVGIEGGASAGIGGKAEFTVSYRNGTFHIKCGAGLTAGLGCKGSFSFELSVEDGFKFIGYLLNCVDYHYVFEIEKAAFEAYKNYAFTLLTLGQQVLTAEKALAVEVIDDFSGWLLKLGNKVEKIKQSISESSFASGTLTNVPPEALGQALITVMLTREQEDFRSIMTILYSTVRPGADIRSDQSANHKLKWTLRTASGMLSPDQDKSASDALKDEALAEGIRILEEFGNAKGKWTGQTPNPMFVSRLHAFLAEKGVK